jgi:SAM-dependent methyltransferase
MDNLGDFKAAQREGWAFFAPLEAITTAPAAKLVTFAQLKARDCVLDVGSGTGVVAITAARAGASVSAVDLTPELLDVARHNAQLAGVEVDWHEGDAEALPFEPNSFDVVLSQFGHMFAPRPDIAVDEMLRVLRPGGIIAFSTWPPELFTGRMFNLTARYAPPPPLGVAPPPLWGDPTIIRERLGTRVRELTFDRGVMLNPALSPAHHRSQTERFAGPVRRFIETTQDPARLAEFRRDYDALVGQYFDSNVVRQDFLMTRAVKL